MNLRMLALAAGAALLMPLGASAVDALTSLHPEAAYPDDAPRLSSPGPYSGFIKEVQEKLHAFGFDAGPVNGDFGTKTQAALAQFQLSRTLPASGMLDDRTLSELGVERGPQQSGSGSTDERVAQNRSLGGSCDVLIGQEKERCLRQGGTVEAGMTYWQAPAPHAAAVEAQRVLSAEGYDPGPADGSLNAKTVRAVKQAQKDRELEPTGQLDRRTAAALGIDVERSAAAGGSAPSDVEGRAGTRSR